ncbi:MAG TPA: hypothetical protein VI895_09390 [Bdellovibrionota bacterium]|nr:hypothetical protein [Bdellovibrionota bacterium]
MSRWSFILFVTVLFAASCGRPYRTEATKSAPQETEKVLLLDHGLTYYFNIVKQKADRLPGGQLQVKLEVENEEDKDVWTDVQVIFRAEDGFEVEKTDWEPVLFHRRTVTSYQKNSLNPKAADYRVLIRNAK